MPRLYHRKHNRIGADGVLARDTYEREAERAA
jgi:hypothetical protein